MKDKLCMMCGKTFDDCNDDDSVLCARCNDIAKESVGEKID